MNNMLTTVLIHRRRRAALRRAANLKKICALESLLSYYRNTNSRNVWTHERGSRFWEDDVPKYSDCQFKNNFRIERSTFSYLVNRFQHLKRRDTNMRKGISVEKRVAVALYALSSSVEYKKIANLFGIGISTVCEMVLEFCESVNNKLANEFLKDYPFTDERLKEIVEGFQSLGFPQCCGAIDGCHIEVSPSKQQAPDYYNFKGWYSIILFAAVDHKCRFTYINVGGTGSSNDSHIFENSSLKRYHEENDIFKKYINVDGVNVPIMLIGDSAFQLSSILMKPYPYRINQPEHERNFNKKLSSSRRVVKNAFGRLKARFRRLGKGFENRIENVSSIVKACCILHNICTERDDRIVESWLQFIPSSKHQPNVSTTLGNKDKDANAIRNAISSYLGLLPNVNVTTDEDDDIDSEADLIDCDDIPTSGANAVCDADNLLST
ncbi:protein ANTAGONIST OF LIKE HETEROCHROMATIN PROTEIN 1-like [Teleopsis dalmanni]|uniref:protein ANTAGONIST OF LIKE HETEROCHROMATIN PROTEIN 1-like n=1 Tax=Teleopsis dalmanni TaxID=139649 RepID=UPI0018CED62A|nr:protein ANTAGONIST OF LIKE HETEROCHROMATIN PROTEIN 1-like [Teleopsis dalmanni]